MLENVSLDTLYEHALQAFERATKDEQRTRSTGAHLEARLRLVAARAILEELTKERSLDTTPLEIPRKVA